MLKDYFSRIDVGRLAGVRSVLGLELTDTVARFVELENQGSILNRAKPRFTVIKSFSVDLQGAQNRDEQASRIKEALKSQGVTSRYVVSSVRTGVKWVTAPIPASAGPFDRWIGENLERLMRLPVTRSEVTFAYRLVENSKDSKSVQIAFARTADVESHLAFITTLGLEPVALGVGLHDSLNAWLLFGQHADKTESSFAFSSGGELIWGRYRSGKLLSSVTTRLENSERALEQIEGLAKKEGLDISHLVTAGEMASSTVAGEFKPLELNSQYSLALGLAVRGFVPEIDGVDLLPEAKRESHQATVLKSLTQRVVIASGILLMALLLLPLLISFYVDKRLEAADEKMLALGAPLAQLSSLEKQVKELEQQLSGPNAAVRSSSVSKLMHEVAAALPKETWLYRFSFDASSKTQPTLQLYGYSIRHDNVTEYLRSLAALGYETNLTRSGSPLETESLLPSVARRNSYVSFQIALSVGK